MGFLYFLAVVSFIVVIVGILIDDIYSDKDFRIIAVFSLVGLLILVALFGFLGGQKNGQISALSGDVEYELVTNSDSSRTWEKIKKLKE